MTDLLLVTPPSRKKYIKIYNTFAAIEPPVWSGLIAEYINNKISM